MLFDHWFYLIDFALLDLRSMNLLYVRHCYLFIWFWAWVRYINTYVSAIDGMITWVWHTYYTAKVELINEVKYYNFIKIKRKRNMVWTGLVMWNSLSGAYAWDSPHRLMCGRIWSEKDHEEFDPRKIMNDLIRERSWSLWFEKDHEYFDPRKITKIDLNKRSSHDPGSPKPKPKGKGLKTM